MVVEKDEGARGGPKSLPMPALTLPNVALLIFAALALLIGILALYTVIFPAEDEAQFNAISRSFWVLLAAALASVALAWLSPDNTNLLGRGVRHLLSIQRAAVGSFVIASAGTVAILAYIVFAAGNSAELRHGLYLLAAIEFLLKLSAVSAIIVLITLRRAPARIQRREIDQETQEETVVLDESGDRGQLEFGGLAFAFGLVVIAGLVIPNEDLMRLSSMFFGDDKKVEDYLPRQPILAVEDNLGELIVTHVNQSASVQLLLRDFDYDDQALLDNAIRVAVKSVTYDTAIENARRTGTLNILEKVCAGTHEDIIFANSTNRILSDHLAYLVGEGLIGISYDDLTSMTVTDYGNDVMYKHRSKACVGYEDEHELPSDSARSLVVGSVTPVAIGETPASFALSLAPGNYYAALIAQDDSDPILQLVDRDGVLLQEDDDSGPGSFDAVIYFTVGEDSQSLLLRARAFGQPGNAQLHIAPADRPLPPAVRPRAYSSVTTAFDLAMVATPIEMNASGTTRGVPVPGEGTVLSFTAAESGTFQIDFGYSAENAAFDLVATLFQLSPDRSPAYSGYDDDGGNNGLPRIITELVANETYRLVIQHFRNTGDTTVVDVTIGPVAETPPEEEIVAPAATASETEQEAPPPPATEPAPTGSDGSQSDP